MQCNHAEQHYSPLQFESVILVDQTMNDVLYISLQKKDSECCKSIQGQLQEWTEHSTLIFENLKPVEISKNIFNII